MAELRILIKLILSSFSVGAKRVTLLWKNSPVTSTETPPLMTSRAAFSVRAKPKTRAARISLRTDQREIRTRDLVKGYIRRDQKGGRIVISKSDYWNQN